MAVLLVASLFAPRVGAQPNSSPQYVTLYAHSTGTVFFLNALPQWGGQKIAGVSDATSFKLTPTLGEPLRIYGAITFTIYLQATSALIGNLVVELLEQKPSGTEVPVSGAEIESPVALETRALPVTLGVGTIDYEFSRGSSIILRVTVNNLSVSGVPYLAWDSPATPTNIRIPTINAIQAQLTYSGRGLTFNKILQSDQNGNANVTFLANVTDAIGAYALSPTAQLVLSATNGTNKSLAPTQLGSSSYATTFSTNTILGASAWQVKLLLRDASGTSYEFDDTFWVAPFYPVKFNVVDSSGVGINNMTVSVSVDQALWANQTDRLGLATFELPSSEIVGPLNLTISRNFVLFQNSTLDVVSQTTIFIRLHIYHVTLRITVSGLPVPDGRIELLQNGHIIAQGTTDAFGNISFTQIPVGNYTLLVHYLFNDFETSLSVATNQAIAIEVPFPHVRLFVAILVVLIGSVSTVGLVRKRRHTFPVSFSYFSELTSGGLPATCFTVIAGNSGSGKTTLLESIAGEHLRSAGCVYITNSDFPSKIRENMTNLGVLPTNGSERSKILFIDAYSALGGAQSKEEFHITSPTDLTGLGLQISRCLEKLGSGTDVYLDSLSPFVNALRMDYLLNFLQSIAAKVKANDGKLCVTVGTAIEKSDLTKLEENSDCVIETQLQEGGKGQRRRLRVKKLRAKAYIEKWTRFQIESGKGITFLVTRKPVKSRN
jgi:KaiC/GvpD/RAD55 family RecA-like ATPase